MTPALLGMLIGIEPFLQECRKNGRWRIKGGKAVFFVLPALFLSYCMVVFPAAHWPLPSSLLKLLSLPGATGMASVLFGYSLITMFYREDSWLRF